MPEKTIEEQLKDLKTQITSDFEEKRKAADSELEQKLTAQQEKFNSLLEQFEQKEEKEKEDFQALKEDLQKQFDEMAMQSKEAKNDNRSFAERVAEKLSNLKDDFKNLRQQKKDIVFNLKAAGTTTTGNATLPTAAPASYIYQDMNTVIPQTELIPFVMNYTDNAPTDRVSLAWVNEVNGEGDAAFIGEGVVKPLIDVDFETEFSQAKKVAGKIKVSEEALMDIPFMTAEINRKLRLRHDLVKQDGILNGDGIGANLKGITEYAAAFAAGGLANSIDDANNYDAIIAAYNQILVTSDGNYVPNAVFVHPTDATLMQLTKDTDGNYVLPPFSDSNGNRVNGVQVVANTKIPLGYMLMGDFTKSHVRDYMDFEIRIGYTGDDFEKNLVTILGESRVHHYISDNETTAFVYDQFSVIKAAIDPDLT